MFRNVPAFFHPLCFIVGLITLMGAQSKNFSMDPGVGWHIATGNWILENRTVPIEDPFLITPLGTPPRIWVSDQWLSDVLLASWVRFFEWSGTYLIITVVFISTFFIFLYKALRLTKHAAIPATFATLLAFKLAQIHFLLRPVVFSFFFFTVIWVLARHIATTGIIKRGHYLSIPLLFALWANMHPAFVLGLIWLGLACACQVLSAFSCTTQRSYRQQVSCIGLLCLCALATVCNPYGLSLHQTISSLGSSDFFMRFHMEWLSPDFKSTEGSFLLVLLGLVFAGLYCGATRQRRYLLFDFIGVMLGAFLTLRSIRTLPFLGIVSAPVVATSLVWLAEALTGQLELIGFSRFAALLRSAWGRLENAESRSSQIAIPTLGAVLLIVGAVFSRELPVDPEKYSPARAYPASQLVSQLRKESLNSSSPLAIVALPELGGVITLYGYPYVRAVIDDRNTLLGEAHYKEFLAAIQKESLFREFLAKFGARYVLINDNHPLKQLLELWGGFDVVGVADTATLYRLEQ